jgi:CheY-like chemotaxis protein
MATDSEQFSEGAGHTERVSFTRRRVGPIVLVDDDDDARACAREALEAAGHAVIEAVNGQQALNFLVSRPNERVALIILDLQMPVMDGWRFIDLVRCYVGLSKIPILVVTAAPEPHLEQIEHKAVFGCIRAPYELRTLLEMVTACLDVDAQASAGEARP